MVNELGAVLKVLHVISSISRQGGGPARSCQGLVSGERKAGVDAWVWPINGGEPWIAGVRCISGIVDLEQAERAPLLRCPEVRLREFDLVHIHGIWSWKLHRVAVMCRKVGVPYVIAPRGMLEPWSLKQKWLKKRIARWLYQDRDLRLAAALHATAESEAEQFRRLGFKNQIIISPNGVNVPEGDFGTQVVSRHANLTKSDVATTPTSSATRPAAVSALRAPAVQSAFCQGSSRRALFVSRMHPKKGVLELVESWARVKLKGWCCELVYTMNSDEERAYEKKVKQRVHELGLNDQFVFTGALDDEKKWEAYVRADLFVLPTYSENFGIVVAEAFWAGVPVITTKGTPWVELECSASSKFKVQSSKLEERCGWWIDLPEAKVELKGQGLQWPSLDSALREACGAAGIRALPEMGRRGRALVESRYTWVAVTKAVVEGYNDILK